MNRPPDDKSQDEDQKPEDDLSQIVTSTGISSAQSASEDGDPRPTLPGKGKTVALTLGSGGARGYAHIGAIEILVERGYDIVAISGCSMGALIGGVFAAGKMKDYKDWVTGLGQFDVLKLLDVTFSSVGAIRGEKIFSVVREMIGDTRIEDLPIAYTAVATDLLAHKEIWFQEGPLDQAIRASVAIPSVVTPLVLNGRVLVDGALLNPLPIIPTISSHADMIVAVNLSGEDDRGRRLPDAAFESPHDEGGDIEEWVDKIREKASRWFDWDALKTFSARKESDSSDSPEEKISKAVAKNENNKKTPAVKPEPKKNQDDHETIDWDKLGIGKFDVMNLTIETMQSALVQYKIAGYPPDLLVNIPKNAGRSYDYHKAPELIQLGRERMAAALDRYEKNLNSSGPLAI
ncbi:patatin-like phospholipase family protein [Marinobacter sp. 71-i]|uniref:Patatin-like phospholipase family protein n=1 Tax=Marinobacter iranensis TaxID=2962607 RepID=A0ABT5Y9W9_9GAMM|nr:patatin-like phospholipase family protein [Marinobacter iranensis]MDF0750402.1 patatin-like phospholipase family protein [Marinobacter iranensis]